MPKCKLCAYPQRATIEKEVASRKLSFAAAGRVVGCSNMAIKRHMGNHVSKKVAKAANAIETHEGIDVLKQLSISHNVVLSILSKAYNAGAWRTALFAIDTETRQLKLTAQLTGQFPDPKLTIEDNRRFDIYPLRVIIEKYVDRERRPELSKEILELANFVDEGH
jgi:hypothetical protein